MIRKAIGSGQFYPGNKLSLGKFISKFKPKKEIKIDAIGLILPHAGYMYSGEVAITTVGSVQAKKTIIALGPNHSGLGVDFAVWTRGEWETPLGSVKINENLASSILSRSDLLKENFSSHKAEHSIEVELPILQYFFGSFELVPIACKQSNSETYRKVAKSIFESTKKSRNEVLFVASTDLTHYETDASTRRKDSLAIEAIINLNDKKLQDTVKREQISMCGLAPVSVFISCLNLVGASKVQVSLYKTSGDTTGDMSSVVGYVGMIVK